MKLHLQVTERSSNNGKLVRYFVESTLYLTHPTVQLDQRNAVSVVGKRRRDTLNLICLRMVVERQHLPPSRLRADSFSIPDTFRHDCGQLFKMFTQSPLSLLGSSFKKPIVFCCVLVAVCTSTSVGFQPFANLLGRCLTDSRNNSSLIPFEWLSNSEWAVSS